MTIPMEQQVSTETGQPPQPRPQRTQIMTVDEVAKYLGVHRITIYRLLQASDIPAVKLHGQWRFKKDILDQWLTSRMQARQRKPSKSKK